MTKQISESGYDEEDDVPQFGRGRGGGGQNQSFHRRGVSEVQPQTIEVRKGSLIGQMMDPMNKSKSQQVLVIEHMIKGVADLMEVYKTREKKLDEIIDMLLVLAKRNDPALQGEVDLEDFLSTTREQMILCMEDMKTAAATFAAMPAVIDGERGVIEAEIQPAAPVMKRADGSSLRDQIYVDQVDVTTPTTPRPRPAQVGAPLATNRISSISSATSVASTFSSALTREIRDQVVKTITPILQTRLSEDVLDVMFEDVDYEDHRGAQRKGNVMSAVVRFLSVYVSATGRDLGADDVSPVMEMIEDAGPDGMTDLITNMMMLSLDPEKTVSFLSGTDSD